MNGWVGRRQSRRLVGSAFPAGSEATNAGHYGFPMTTRSVGQAGPSRGDAAQRPSSLWRGAALCLVSATGFGVAAIFAKESYRAGVSVPTMLAVRFALAAAIFWVVVAWRRPTFPRRRVLLSCVGLGAAGYALQAALYFGALTRISASLTALLLYAYPALVTVLAVVLRRERADRRRVAALACSAAGLVLLLGTGGTAGSAAISGVLLALGAAVTYAVYLTVAVGLPADLDVYLLSAVVCTAAAASMGMAGLATGSLHQPARPGGWLWMALLAVFSTVVPIATLLAGMRQVGAPTAAILSCAEPAVTVTSTAVVYGDRLTVGQAVGGAAVLSAVAILQISRRQGAGRRLRLRSRNPARGLDGPTEGVSMTALESLVNLGPKLAADLRAVDVPDVETLRAVGADVAAQRLADAGLRDCTHARRALEGALAGVRWTAEPA
jgi:drug/metabolite transporter (DMT)-like permease